MSGHLLPIPELGRVLRKFAPWVKAEARDAELLKLCEALEAERAKLEAADAAHWTEDGWDPYAKEGSEFERLAQRIGAMQPTTLAGYKRRQEALWSIWEWGLLDVSWLAPEDKPDPERTQLQWRV
jgi:hypothetical protein